MKLVFRKPGGNGEAVTIEGIVVTVDTFFIHVDGKVIASHSNAKSKEDGSWRLEKESGFEGLTANDFSVQVSSPSEIAIAIRRERARCLGVVQALIQELQEAASRTTSFKALTLQEGAVDACVRLREGINHLRGEYLLDNPWKTAVEQMVSQVRFRENMAPTEETAKAFNQLWEELKALEQAARYREASRL